MSQPVRPAFVVAVAALAAVVLVQVLLLVQVLVSVYGPASNDPHGFGVIFGVGAIVVLMPLTIVLGALLRSLRRRR